MDTDFSSHIKLRTVPYEYFLGGDNFWYAVVVEVRPWSGRLGLN
jgi:hypothetical protein